MKVRFLSALLMLVVVSTPMLPATAANAALGFGKVPGLTLIESGASGVVLELATPDFEVEHFGTGAGAFQTVTIDGYAYTSRPGGYRLPVVHALLGVPPQAEIEVQLLAVDQRIVDQTVRLGMAPGPAPLNDSLQPGRRIAPGFVAPRSDSAIFPSSPVEIVNEAWFRDQRIVLVALYPFQYDASKERLLWHSRLRVGVSFTSRDKIGPQIQERSSSSQLNDVSGAFDQALESVLLNYQDARRWRGSPPASSNGSLSRELVGQASNGPRYRITIDEDGIYQIAYKQLDDLRDLGGPVESKTIHMSSQGEDVAILVDDGGDGFFYSGDQIKFYGQKFSGDLLAQKYVSENAHWMDYSPQTPEGGFELWQPQFNTTMLEKYTDENVYWLEIGASEGLRMEDHPTSSGGAPIPQYYTETVRVEESHEWFTFSFTGEDTWFWDRLQPSKPPGDPSLVTLTGTYTTTLSDLVTEPISATVRAELVGRRSAGHQFDHHTRFYLNDSTAPIDDYRWVGVSRYGFEARVPQSQLTQGENALSLVVLLDAYDGQISDDVYFDWFEIEYMREFKALDDRLSFSRDEGGQSWQYSVSDFSSSQVEVYDVTDPLKPVLIPSQTIAGEVSFKVTHSGVAHYFLAGSDAIQAPNSMSYYQPPDLKSSNLDADYVFITHADFYATTQTLAHYRASQGLSTVVIDVQDLYNEFNYGIFHPIAIKNFLAYTYAQWGDLPSYVLLVGDGHWNFKNYQSRSPNVDYSSPTPVFMPPNLSWVDPWQGEVDSANLLATVVGTDPLPDVSIARLPVNSVEQLQAITNKIKDYESTPLEKWQYGLLFIADDADASGDYAGSSDALISGVIPSGYSVNRVYLPQNPSQIDVQAARDAVIDTMNSGGASLVNFLGHGAIDRWANEGIFTNEDIPSLSNSAQLPVVLSMDCLDGYWLHPRQPSLIEELLRAEGAGMVAGFSPTGLGVATGHDALQHGFYQAVFEHNVRELGPATLSAKLALYATGGNFDLLHTFTIFGDPALVMQIPAAPVYLPISIRSAP